MARTRVGFFYQPIDDGGVDKKQPFVADEWRRQIRLETDDELLGIKAAQKSPVFQRPKNQILGIGLSAVGVLPASERTVLPDARLLRFLVEQKQHLAEQDFPSFVLVYEHMIVVRATAGSGKGARGGLNDIPILVHNFVYSCFLEVRKIRSDCALLSSFTSPLKNATICLSRGMSVLSEGPVLQDILRAGHHQGFGTDTLLATSLYLREQELHVPRNLGKAGIFSPAPAVFGMRVAANKVIVRKASTAVMALLFGFPPRVRQIH